MPRKQKIIDDSLQADVSEHYKKFFAKFSEIDKLEVKDWNATHLLAYLCRKYEEYYGVRYTFSFNAVPSKSTEIFQMNKMANMLTKDAIKLKDYIDWVFKTKIIEKKKRITSLGFFTNQSIINDYKFKFLLTKNGSAQKIERSSPLPSNVISMCSRHGFNIKTYAELAFIKKMPNQDRLFNELSSIDFKIDVLDKIA